MARPAVLTPQDKDFPRWYQDVLAKAELAETGPVRGTMVIRPYGYSIWERIQAELDQRIKATGARNAYFPLFIPESYLRREADHVEGFSPELAVVTHAGGRQLEEPVIVRPTSETIIGEYLGKWINSYRDLPMLLNQWANVVRWELRPRLFLRTTEFLWQEGHTAHATEADASLYARRILIEVYAAFMSDVLAIPVVTGRKTARERFAGAVATWTCEAMMGDGKALQMATSHELGQNFARAFDISFSDDGGRQQLAWTTSWGSSTRIVGGLIMSHGDDAGLRVPPRLAPVQVVVTAVKAGPGVTEAVETLAKELASSSVRVEVDQRTDIAFGRRAVDWELKGVPVRIEIGPRDVAAGSVTVVRRIPTTTESVPLPAVAAQIGAMLEADQALLAAEAGERQRRRTADVDSEEACVEAAADGWARIPWDRLGPEGETRLATQGVSVRCLIAADGTLPESDEEPGLVAVVGRAY